VYHAYYRNKLIKPTLLALQYTQHKISSYTFRHSMRAILICTGITQQMHKPSCYMFRHYGCHCAFPVPRWSSKKYFRYCFNILAFYDWFGFSCVLTEILVRVQVCDSTAYCGPFRNHCFNP